jgi:outer membrane immunogenic protein
MRRIATAFLTLSVMACPTVAADLAPQPSLPQPAPITVPAWTGFHVGFAGGGGFANSRNSFSLAGFQFAPTFGNSPRGAVGSAEAGYDWQLGALVVGAAADFSVSGVRGTRTAPCGGGVCAGLPVSATYTQKLPWFGTLRPRVGYAIGSALLYVTGGYAYARLETDATATFGPFSATHDGSQTRNGWALGAGAEYEFASHWSAKLEYLHLDLGRSSSNWAPAPLPPISNTAHFDLDMVRGGVNYRF